ncbi:hypothetical protein HOF65_02040 [bacterium]|nr:hypothetical protein [bacterium]MBT3852788.1 hypothetical protein [bacterium]
MMIDSIDQNDGKIVLTQTPEMNKTIAVFDDIYSFFRSQSYSLNSIEEKQQVFTELKEKIEELLL